VRHVILEFLRKRSADFQVFFPLACRTVMSIQEKSTVQKVQCIIWFVEVWWLTWPFVWNRSFVHEKYSGNHHEFHLTWTMCIRLYIVLFKLLKFNLINFLNKPTWSPPFFSLSVLVLTSLYLLIVGVEVIIFSWSNSVTHTHSR
jgi:hypothetical protein